MSTCCLNEFGQVVLLKQLATLCSIIHAADGHFEQLLKHVALCNNIHFGSQLYKLYVTQFPCTGSAKLR
jgi:hypothetical protein